MQVLLCGFLLKTMKNCPQRLGYFSRSQEYLRFYLRRHLGKYFRMIVALVHSQNFETPGLYGFWKVMESYGN